MRRVLASAVVFAACAHAQTFEAATIKPSGPHSVRGSEGGPGSKDPTRYRFEVASLMDFIAIAWHIDSFQISSKLSLDKDRYDLEARVPPGATREEFRLMMQALLAERFHLKYHTEARDFAAYEMTVAKGGPKFAVSDDPSFPKLAEGKPGFTSMQSNSGRYLLVRMKAQQQPMMTLAQFLHMPAGRPVVDKTGLAGRYDFTLAFTTDLPGPASSGTDEPPAAPDLFSAIQRQLGLQLAEKKLPFPVVVVEAVDKLPVEN